MKIGVFYSGDSVLITRRGVVFIVPYKVASTLVRYNAKYNPEVILLNNGQYLAY